MARAMDLRGTTLDSAKKNYIDASYPQPQLVTADDAFVLGTLPPAAAARLEIRLIATQIREYCAGAARGCHQRGSSDCTRDRKFAKDTTRIVAPRRIKRQPAPLQPGEVV
jgi:hypothetical protein